MTRTRYGPTSWQIPAPNLPMIIEQEALRQDCAVVLSEIKKLPDNQRQAIMLTGWHGMTLQTTADTMSISHADIRRYKRLATDKIRKSVRLVSAHEDFEIKRVGLKEFKTTWTSEVEKSLGLL